MADCEPRAVLGELHRLEGEDIDIGPKRGQRRFVRHRVRGEAELHPMDGVRLDRTPVDIQLRDIGRGGVGFVCARALDVGSVWRVSFLMRGQVIGQQAAIVRHCRRIEEHLYLVGAQFCADSGLLTLLGLDPVEMPLDEPESSDVDALYLSPSQIR